MIEPQSDSHLPVASRSHTLALLLMIAALAYAGVITSSKMRTGAGPSRVVFYSVAMVFEWLIVAYVVVGVRRHGGSLRQLIGGSWTRGRDVARDASIALAFWIAAMLVLGAFRWALRATHNAEAVRFLTPRSKVEIVLWILVSLTAGFCEELIFRGYLQRQFIAWSRSAPAGIVLSAVVFGAGHAYQGAKQTVIIGVYGAMFGMLAYWRRSLRPGMMTHAWHDAVTGLLLRLMVK